MQVSGIMTVGRAEVEYRYKSVVDEESEPEVLEARTLSTTPGKVEIVRPDVYHRVADSHSVQALLVVVAAIALVVVPWSRYTAVRTSNARAMKAE
jgi:hypothetical protein